MRGKRGILDGVLVAFMLVSAVPAVADDPETGRAFNYTDDWAVVSAPPPPGPYRAVNIDPRVPGVDAIPPLSLDSGVAPGSELPSEVTTSAAPAAGIPAIQAPRDEPAASLAAQPPSRPLPPAGASRAPLPRQGGYYPAAPRYPAQTQAAPRGAYPGYRGQPGYGYYGVPYYQRGQQPQQVPPPPVYDSMTNNRAPYGGQPPGN